MLMRDGEPVPLTPKALETLLVLVENSGHVLHKDELMKKLWPDTFVEEANLAVNISSLRKTLGEKPNGGQYIETVPRRGYRFAAGFNGTLSFNLLLDDHSCRDTIGDHQVALIIPKLLDSSM